MCTPAQGGPDACQVGRGGPSFATTHWSVVLAAGVTSANPGVAWEQLCRIYWYPLYAYVRSSGYGPEDAQDLTQEFFARCIEKDYLAVVDRERGRFRWFLLCAIKRFLINEHQREVAVKRGGNRPHVPFDGERAEERYCLEASTSESPDKLFDRAWAIRVIEAAYQRLEEAYALEGKGPLLKLLREFLSGDRSESTYAEAGADLGMTEGAVKVAVHRLRRRYRDLLREEVAQTVQTSAELEEELRSLHAAFSASL